MLTQYGAEKIGEHAFGVSSWTMPSEIWLGLHTSSPGWLGSTSNEISTSGGTNYGRFELTGILSSMDSTTGQILTDSAVEFDAAGTDWGVITHISFHDAEVGGNMIAYEEMLEAQQIVTGDVFQRAPGAIVIQLRGSE